MTERNFETWLATFRPSINTYSYYTDFKKVHEKVKGLKLEIHLLNSLIGSENIEEDFERLLRRYPECLPVLPLLLAVRGEELYCQDERGAVAYDFAKWTQTPGQYAYFMRETGLFDLLQHRIISNLYDYMTGVEVGLDSNGRKNRGGHQMENLVERYLKAAGVEYYKEMYLAEIETKWGLDLSAISAEGTSTKRWDFVVRAGGLVYVMETNFYTSGGSKLNETARSYKMIAEEAKSAPGCRFVWITDGAGWKSARRNLEETFHVLEHLYNITDMERGIFSRLFQNHA